MNFGQKSVCAYRNAIEGGRDTQRGLGAAYNLWGEAKRRMVRLGWILNRGVA